MTGAVLNLSSPPRADGAYPAGAQMSIIANPIFGTFPATWGGVDRIDGNIATVEMDSDRFVAVIVFVPTPTPNP